MAASIRLVKIAILFVNFQRKFLSKLLLQGCSPVFKNRIELPFDDKLVGYITQASPSVGYSAQYRS